MKYFFQEVKLQQGPNAHSHFHIFKRVLRAIPHFLSESLNGKICYVVLLEKKEYLVCPGGAVIRAVLGKFLFPRSCVYVL